MVQMVQMMPRILDFGFIPYSDPVRVPRPGGVRSSVHPGLVLNAIG